MTDEQPAPEPEQPKEVLGIPYDFRKPTVQRVKSRMWNSDERRMFPPKSFGAGWTINAYWLVHPVRYFHKDAA